jgi:phosphohistidine phosphatase SixA
MTEIRSQITRQPAKGGGRLLKLLPVFLISAWLTSVSPAATIVIVRHADRSRAMSADALLSSDGEDRARQLSEVLKDAKIQRIYVTEIRRTQQTAEPIAARLHLKPIVVVKENIDELVNHLREAGDNETVLVVGHADTVPLIINRLGAGPAPPIGDTEYDRLTVLFTGIAGKAHSVTLRYGKVGQQPLAESRGVKRGTGSGR